MEIHTKIVFEGNANDLYADGGEIRQTRLLSSCDDESNNLDVTITSYDENCIHNTFNSLLNNKIRITIETL